MLLASRDLDEIPSRRGHRRGHHSGSFQNLRRPKAEVPARQPRRAASRRPGIALSHLFMPFPALPVFFSFCVQLSADCS